ncbi:MAG: polysaccharide biosynthesis/export family protein [Fuerstiella sp.]
MQVFSLNNITRKCFATGFMAIGMMAMTGCSSVQSTPGVSCGPGGCATGSCGSGGYGQMDYSQGGMVAASCNAPMACADGSCGAGNFNNLGGCTDGSCGIGGCTDGGCGGGMCGPNQCEVPRELRKTAMPEYRIEPPDVILIESTNHLRTASSSVNAGESLLIQCARTLPTDPTDSNVVREFKTINGLYVIGNDGYVNLGPEYGKVLCVGQPVNVIQDRVEEHLKRILTKPLVLVTLPDPSTKQVVAGPHLVRPDGTVGLGIYGDVFVAGKSRREAKLAIEQHLSSFIQAPQVTIDVLGYNSKVYYVIADGAGAGEQVYRLPSTGNETVLDAIARVNGLPAIACKGQIWIARPSPECCGPDKILKVDWDGIAQGAQTCTNYQIFPGDRLYVKADPFITFDTNLSKITAPFERILGLTILGTGVVNSIQNGGQGGAGGF